MTVIGSNLFHTRKTSCRFGGEVTPGNVTDDSTFVCIPPASVAGAGFVYVEVSMNSEDFTTSGVAFLYHEPAQLASVHPAGAESGGGAVVTVASRTAGAESRTNGGRGGGGSGFTPDTECVFFGGGGGGVDDIAPSGAVVSIDRAGGGDTRRFVSSSLMSCETPRLTPGPHEITVGRPPDIFSVAAVGARGFAAWRVPRDIALAGDEAAAGAKLAEGDAGGGTSVSVSWSSTSSKEDFFGRGSGLLVATAAPIGVAGRPNQGGSYCDEIAACEQYLHSGQCEMWRY